VARRCRRSGFASERKKKNNDHTTDKMTGCNYLRQGDGLERGGIKIARACQLVFGRAQLPSSPNRLRRSVTEDRKGTQKRGTNICASGDRVKEAAIANEGFRESQGDWFH